jgi:hypothetical protein
VRATLWRIHLGGGCLLALAYVPAAAGAAGGVAGRALCGHDRGHPGLGPAVETGPAVAVPAVRGRGGRRVRGRVPGLVGRVHPGRGQRGRGRPAPGRAGPVDAVCRLRRAGAGPGHPAGGRRRGPEPGLSADDRRLAGAGRRRRRPGGPGAARHLRPLQPGRGRLAGRLRVVPELDAALGARPPRRAGSAGGGRSSAASWWSTTSRSSTSTTAAWPAPRPWSAGPDRTGAPCSST